MTPGRRVWATLGWTAAVTVPLTLTASLAGSGGLEFGKSSEAAAVRDIPPMATQSPTPEAFRAPAPSAAPAERPAPSATPTPSATPEAEVKTQPPAAAPQAAPAPQQQPPAANGAAPKAAPVAPAPPALAPDTAAVAVSRLAAREPGRHICYRAYVEGIGWQKAVCDGATAGTEGQSRRIKALNIAVSGTKGTAANAFVYKEHWKTPWNGVADGIDNYIGGTAKDYPYMLGFVINVGDGAVCQNAAVRGHGWGGLACDEPRGQAPGNYIFGGTLDDNLWLEAVRFTV
ncbi:hypothetical protein [Streptomyces sp. NPDC090022]|uniref:hypothetical protein n=1 Tax=Streptomyces sp. NPDC090022 TaxID=3365920 RepID=UPI0037FB48CF